MPKVDVITTNFTAGEFSPRLRARVDLAKFNSSAALLRNVVVLKQGGATARPPLDFLGEVQDSSNITRPIGFVYSPSASYILEFGDNIMRVRKFGVLVESSPGVPYTVATPYPSSVLADVDFTHAADTMVLFHPNYHPKRLRRFGDADWRFDDAPFSPPAVGEVGSRANIGMTLSAATVGAGRTITAASGFWVAADVGRTFSAGSGAATITAVGSATSATATITSGFAGTVLAGNAWLLEGTPLATLTPSASTPVGVACNLTASVDAWRAADVGKFVEINGGLVEITSFSSATVVGGIIRRELTATAASVADGWVLKAPLWNAIDGYPATGTLHQQRLWAANTLRYPNSAWGSKSGLYFDFTPGTDDDSAVYKTLDSDEINPILFLNSLKTLIPLTYRNEFEIKGGVEKPITQTNAQITPQTAWGCDPVRPEQVGDNMLFMQRGGKVMRALYPLEIEGFGANDISVFSEHLVRAGVTCMSFQQTPESVVWCATGAGGLVPITYSSEQKVIAFTSGDTDGFVEWIVTVPENGDDVTYMVVRRLINGVQRRYVERVNWAVYPGMDSRMQKTGPAATVWTGFDHLEGREVAVLADGVSMGRFTVTGGAITLPRNATKVELGLPYTPLIRLHAPEVGQAVGTSQGQANSTHEVSVRVLETIGLAVNGERVPFQQFDGNLLDQAPQPFTGLKKVHEAGWEEEGVDLELSQPLPYPWTVLAAIRKTTFNQG